MAAETPLRSLDAVSLEAELERLLPAFHREHRRLFGGADRAALRLLAGLIGRLDARERPWRAGPAWSLAPWWLAAAAAERRSAAGTLDGLLAACRLDGGAGARGWSGFEVLEPARGMLELRRAEGAAAVLALVAPGGPEQVGAQALLEAPREGLLPPGARLQVVALEQPLGLARPHHGLRVAGRILLGVRAAGGPQRDLDAPEPRAADRDDAVELDDP